MHLAMYKNRSSSSQYGTVEESSGGDDGSETIAVGEHVAALAGEERFQESLSVEEPIDETFVRRRDRLDTALSELCDVDRSVKLGREDALGLGVG